MRKEYFLIANGNKTLLVWDCPAPQQLSTAKEHLQSVEQVGFIDEEPHLYLSMMGNELCINAILACAFSTKKESGVFYADGVTTPIQFTNTAEKTSISIDLPYIKKDTIVLFDGIGYLCTNTIKSYSKKELRTLANEHTVPAFGIINYKDSEIQPLIYVQKTDSLIEESACGSGSIAMSLVTGAEHITQPSGGVLRVRKDNTLFTIEATVTHVA